MSIREALRKNSGMTALGAVLVIAGAAWYAWSQMSALGGRQEDQAYYTLDDGKTWFLDDLYKHPPFEVNGKTALGAAIYRCADRKEFCAYVFRFTETTLKKMAAATTTAPTASGAPVRSGFVLGPDAVEVRRPGETVWINNANFKESMKIVQPRCPDGTQAEKVSK